MAVTATLVDTRRVDGRRLLSFQSYDEMLAEAEHLAGVETRSLGNWSLGQALKHLALSMHLDVDGSPFDAHPIIRLVARVLYRHRLIHVGMPPGFRLPPAMAEQLVPGPTSIEEGLHALREAVERLRHESPRAAHPLFGRMTAQEWEMFHLRHAELHLSYIVPV